jgi:hypothetical protein
MIVRLIPLAGTQLGLLQLVLFKGQAKQAFDKTEYHSMVQLYSHSNGLVSLLHVRMHGCCL